MSEIREKYEYHIKEYGIDSRIRKQIEELEKLSFDLLTVIVAMTHNGIDTDNVKKVVGKLMTQWENTTGKSLEDMLDE